MTEFEEQVKAYYEKQGYKVYCCEVWLEINYPEGTFVDIEIGGSPEKYRHIRGYKTQEWIEDLKAKVKGALDE